MVGAPAPYDCDEAPAAALGGPEGQVTVVVPIKPLVFAKSRVALPAEHRQALALAFALDTISALSVSPLVAGVLVVTSDRILACRLRQHPVRVIPDEGAGLGLAVHGGLRVATSWKPTTGVAVVPADLPCLRADDVTWAIAAALTADGAFVPDRSTTGTTLLIYPPGRRAVACYGPGSAAKHRSLDLLPLYGAPDRARHDVDTLEDLRVARRLGLGPETSDVVSALDDDGVLDPSTT